MLAMDVVDTLRHEQRLVERALDSEAREAELIERVRRAYAAQGIEVSEAMVVEGVKALAEREFEYVAPEPGFRTRILTAWVRRRRIGGTLAVIALLAGSIWAAWWGFVERPRAQAQAAALVAEQQRLATIAELPDRLERVADAARDAAATDPARAAVETLINNADTALKLQRVEETERLVQELEALTTFLRTVLTVRIVSRPGERTGVIRTPVDRDDVDNYYLIVEALDANNRPVAVDIQSEEDGSTRKVSMWGIRVNATTFNRIRRDKEDDGIVQASAAGDKPAGALRIRYSLANEGGTIYNWANN